MIIFNLNIRGLGGGIKEKYLRQIIAKEDAKFVNIQETKVTEFSDSRCFDMWGDNKVGWVHNEGVNGAGSTLSMWDKETFIYSSHVTGRGFIAVVGHHSKSNCLCVVINVYAACSLSAKAAMWNAFSFIRSSHENEVWCCYGDFNAIRCVEERKGVRGYTSQKKEIRDFNEFSDKNLMVDLLL